MSNRPPVSARRSRLGWIVPASALIALWFAQPACADKTCTPSDGDNTTPGPAFECSAGEVCYLGRCIRTCNAGAELVESCSSDGDCGGARPNCVRTFCSSCEDIDACVPTLNICQSVNEVIIPDPRERPDLPPAVPRPLDAGFTPGGVVRPDRDAGVADQPIDREITRAAFVDLGREVDYASDPPVESPVVRVRAFNTAIGAGNGLRWRVELEPPRVERAFGDPAVDPSAPPITVVEDCEIRRIDTVTGPGGETAQPANIGVIRMGNPADFPGSIDPEVNATFNDLANGYDLDPVPVVPTFLTFSVSVPTEPHFVFVSGDPLDGVVARIWPDGSDFGHHIPFELVPSAATESQLQTGFQVANPAAQDLTFRYDRIETGNDGFEAVFVRIVGQRTELFCEQLEGPSSGGDLRVRAAILDAFRVAEGLTTPATYDLIFERASRELTQPVGEDDQLVLVTIRIRHSLKTPIAFQ